MLNNGHEAIIWQRFSQHVSCSAALRLTIRPLLPGITEFDGSSKMAVSLATTGLDWVRAEPDRHYLTFAILFANGECGIVAGRTSSSVERPRTAGLDTSQAAVFVQNQLIDATYNKQHLIQSNKGKGVIVNLSVSPEYK